jgi:D-amino peptidase
MMPPPPGRELARPARLSAQYRAGARFVEGDAAIQGSHYGRDMLPELTEEARVKVYISTVLEGISGVTTFEQTRDSDGPLYQSARHLLMGDINAAVQGCLDGGASSVCVVDGHGRPLNVIPEEMHPGADFICGRGFGQAAELDATFDCGMLIGFHAMAHTPDGVLCHTQSSLSDSRYWYNDREFGEIGQEAMVLGHFDIPIVLVSGDEEACREAREFLGESVVTVPVKKGYSRESCRMVPPARAHNLIRAGAEEAMGRVPLCQPFKMQLPIRGRLETLAEALPRTASPALVAAAPRRTFEGVFDDQLHIYSFS